MSKPETECINVDTRNIETRIIKTKRNVAKQADQKIELKPKPKPKLKGLRNTGGKTVHPKPIRMIKMQEYRKYKAQTEHKQNSLMNKMQGVESRT